MNTSGTIRTRRMPFGARMVPRLFDVSMSPISFKARTARLICPSVRGRCLVQYLSANCTHPYLQHPSASDATAPRILSFRISGSVRFFGSLGPL